jgi:hypothetical protein
MWKTPDILNEYAKDLTRYYEKADPALAPLAGPCFLDTAQRTVQLQDNGEAFVITGDIPAMWLRDSSAQVVNYIPFHTNPEVKDFLLRLVETQASFILLDPYANAFNQLGNGDGFKEDLTQMHPHVWERKFEVDSLCAPILLAHAFWKTSKDDALFTPTFKHMLKRVAQVFETEQNHDLSSYRFQRQDCLPKDTLANEGKGRPCAKTGMIWSGFRPSDDACVFPYHIPANMMAASAMHAAQEMALHMQEMTLAWKCAALEDDIRKGIDAFGKTIHPIFGEMYVYETDGLGHQILMDDANSPSLLAAPWIGFCDKEDPIYQNTRAFALSKHNFYYQEGKYAKGIGSPHTPEGYVWPLGLIMQALTSLDKDEVSACLKMLSNTHAGCFCMHESFDPDDPSQFTRPWFAWADTLFAALLIQCKENGHYE